MAWTQTDIDRLKRAIALNVRLVKYSDGEQVEYPTLDEQLKALAVMQAEVSAAAGDPPKRRAFHPGFRTSGVH